MSGVVAPSSEGAQSQGEHQFLLASEASTNLRTIFEEWVERQVWERIVEVQDAGGELVVPPPP